MARFRITAFSALVDPRFQKTDIAVAQCKFEVWPLLHPPVQFASDWQIAPGPLDLYFGPDVPMNRCVAPGCPD